MELPFAVESSEELPNNNNNNDDDDGSLVTTASSQGDRTILQSYDTGTSAHESFASSFLPSRLISAVSQWGNTAAAPKPQRDEKLPPTTEINDYTYVNVWETDEVDIVEKNHEESHTAGGSSEIATTDILTLLLNPTASTELTQLITQANEAVAKAAAFKRQGDLVTSVQHQSQAAQLYYQAAMHCRKEGYVSFMKSLFLLSQIQAKGAAALQQVIKLPANCLRDLLRGALKEDSSPDLSESTFLGEANRATTTRKPSPIIQALEKQQARAGSEALSIMGTNPIDEMLALERELRDMDMALEMGNSIASLDARKSNQLKMDGSFMVVRSALPTPRARANRVQATRAKTPHYQEIQTSLDSSQIMCSSVASLAASAVLMSHPQSNIHYTQSPQPDNTKQIMRLMDSLKTLGDENAALLRRVEDADRARIEAKMAQKAMENFREEYNTKFQVLKDALKRFQNDYPSPGNPVNTSEFMDGTRHNDQLIRKLKADLQKEKEQSKRKDAALKKYEAFYKEVKARSAMKQAQRQKQHHQAVN